MPDLMEGQSRHRWCAQETQTNRFARLALTETHCLTSDAAVDAHVKKWLVVREGSPINVEAFGGGAGRTKGVRKGAV
jgi:hypothetical protein